LGSKLALLMRLRIVHTLSLLLLSAVMVAVLAMAAMMAWNLKNGFSDYLNARDVERLEQFCAVAAQLISQTGGLEAMRQRSPDMRELLTGFAQNQGIKPRRPAGPPPMHPPPRRPPPGGADGFGPRLTVVGTKGEPLFDRPTPQDSGTFVDRPIVVDGVVVALARLRASGRVSDALEARFLRNQYLGIFAVAALLVCLALASAWWLARRWARPLQAVQEATARIARGESDVRVQVTPKEASRSDEVGDVVRNINQMADSLQRLEDSRRRWLADMSHELRTPLAVLRGEIEALIDGVRPLEAKALLSLREEVVHLGSLVNDLHMLAMSDLQALPCQFVDIDALDVLGAVHKRFEARAMACGLSLTLQCNGLSALPVCWDRLRIEQLLSNVLENSLRYTDAPGSIAISVLPTHNQVAVTVEDSAPGVEEHSLQRLFEPLYRADTARSRHTGGSGLGLAICEAITRSHGGTISAQQSALGGIRICITLPQSAEVKL
jgi:two-component system, OmpR family, sensor histidine kinase BaeS